MFQIGDTLFFFPFCPSVLPSLLPSFLFFFLEATLKTCIQDLSVCKQGVGNIEQDSGNRNKIAGMSRAPK